MMRARSEKTVKTSYHFLPVLVFASWACVFLGLLWKGNYQNYIASGFWPVVLVGLLAMLIFMSSAIRQVRKPSLTTKGLQPWLSGLLLLLPIVFIQLGNNHSLGSYALTKRAWDINSWETHQLRPTPTPSTLPENYGEVGVSTGPDFSVQPNEVDLGEISDYVDQLEGHAIITTGMVHRGKRTPAGHFVLFRFAINCCIADSRAIAFLVESEQTETLEDNQWVRVEGILQTELQPGLKRIWILAHDVNYIPKPPVNERYLKQ
jgi:uncharacterized repeat protein (TIGR03943 family)